MIQSFLFQAAGESPIPETDRTGEPRHARIALGTPETHPLHARLLREGALDVQDLGEGFLIQLRNEGGAEYILVAGETPRGALYGTVRLLETALEQRLQRAPADLEFRIPQPLNWEISALDERSKPFYPARMTLETEPPDWLARMRVNASGAEGVWTGTGIDDGLGAAVQYVLAFERLQDIPFAQREARARALNRRFDDLKRKGVDPFLFMYLTGEPTKALIVQRPDLLGPAVAYPASRNGRDYRPFCWSNPDALLFFGELIREIMRTYPSLAGLHLRAWGRETRACECEQCGGSGDNAQRLLWNIAHTVIREARSVRPDARFVISGYNRSWLQDPDGEQLRLLPPNTTLLQKWGADGEPTADPGIDAQLLRRVHNAGQRLVVLSHDVEETQPLWMLESELFARGVLRAANDPETQALAGFTLQGQIGRLRLDQRISARMNWEPSADALQLIDHALANRYGDAAGPPLARALRRNGDALANFFLDYGGILTLAGDYKKGSKWFATRMWDLFGENALHDILNLPDPAHADYALQRLADLRTLQDEAADNALQAAQTAAVQDAPLNDALALMEAWSAFFACREQFALAVREGYRPEPDAGAVGGHIAQAERKLRETRDRLDRIERYLPLLHNSAERSKQLMLSRIDDELEALQRLDIATVLRPQPEPEPPDENGGSGAPAIVDPILAPSPIRKSGGADFVLTLPNGAERLAIRIYTASGRRVASIERGSEPPGTAEIRWDGNGRDGQPLPNGAYYYRISAQNGDETRYAVGKFAVIR